MNHYQHDDGGRAEAGYKGDAGDCAVRAVAIATRKPYAEVYAGLRDANAQYSSRRNRVARTIRERGNSPRNGVFNEVLREYMASLNWRWEPTMSIGSGCTLHVDPHELPHGRLVLRLSRHFCAAVDGVVHDTYDCTRDGTRCVYGYYASNV